MSKSQTAHFDLKYDFLLGRFIFNDLPSLRPRSIRMFLCAPYNDTNQEATYLFNNIFPKLREYCMSRYGLEFQVVNLNWDIEIENSLTEESLFEIQKCKEQSLGIQFLGLIGHENGTPLLPSFIERNVLDAIIKCLSENGRDCSSLKNYYKLNINYLSNRYELQECLEAKTKETMFDLIHQGAKDAVQKNLISVEFLNELNETILQKLMKKGIIENKSNENISFCFVKIDPSQKNEYPMVINTLEYLRDRQINYYLPADQLYRIKTNELDECYFKNFGLFYKKTFENYIDKTVKSNSEYSYDILNEQVLYHLNYIKLNRINEVSPRTQNIIKQITDYVLDNTIRQPFIIIGEPGSGKTSVISTLASNLFLQLAANESPTLDFKNHAIIVRFIGIDGKCNYLRYLLKSICCQLQYIKTGSLSDIDKVPNELKELKFYFRKFLTDNFEIDENRPKRKIIIILDSLQDLSRHDYSYKFDWLPKYLNSLCKVILTVSSQSKELIERLNRKFSDTKCYAKLESLNMEQTEYMVKKLLNTKNYRLEPNQYDLIYNLVKSKNIVSLNVKLWSEEFLNWKSFTPNSECILKDTLYRAVQYFLVKLENKFESKLVKHILGYITISQPGLSEMELQDILSLDNELLKIFKAKNLIKSKDNVLRMPWYYILSVINSLRNHLLTKPLHGIYILGWKHSIFKEVIFDKYLGDNSFLKYLHTNVSEYYLGLWSSPKAKPLKYEVVILQKSDNSDKELSIGKPIVKEYNISADRLCPLQPLQFESFHAYVKPRFNLRKLALMPYHLVNADMIDELYKNVFFNIDWIYAKIRAFDIYSVLYDFDLYKQDHEVNLVGESLKMSQAAILEDPNLLFGQLIGRLLPYYQFYDKIRNFTDQCDAKCSIINPLIPVGQIFQSPSWIYQDIVDLGLENIDDMQLELVESDFNGQILVNKKINSPMTKIFDLNLLSFKNEIFTGKGKIYCSKNGDFVCLIENNSKLLIRRIESGEFYGSVEFETCEIAQVVLSSKYACFILRKIPSPLIIDLNTSTIIKTLPYHTCFCAISPDETVIIVHSESSLNYHLMSNFDRVITLEAAEIPEKIVFCNKNRKMCVLSKDTKQITFFSVNLEKKLQTSRHVLQDPNIFDMKISQDESLLIVCALYCVYILNIDDSISFKFKINLIDVENYINLDPKLNDDVFELIENKPKIKNFFNGFGCTQNQSVVYATMYTYLICYNAKTGDLLRIFQSTLSANRIIKSLSSNLQDQVVSLLDNGKILVWNLKSIEMNHNVHFEDQKIFNTKIESCHLPKIAHNSLKNSNLCLTYTKEYPDAKTLDSKNNFHSKSIVKTCFDEKSDNSFTSVIKLVCLDENGKFCFIVSDIDDFNGKKIPEEKDFYKKICSIIDLSNDNRIIDEFSYIIRKNFRFEINAKFIHKKTSNLDEVYLIVKQVSCLNDFDPFCTTELDWTEFETCVKILGPINSHISKIQVFDEFKPCGESLEHDICVTKDAIFASLMQECSKLFDKNTPGLIKAKRYDVHLDTYDLFESKENNLKVQVFNLNEFLTYEENSLGKYVFLDIRVLSDGNLFLIYSKEGFCKENSNLNYYEFDKESLKFNRNIFTEKGALVYDPKQNQVIKKYSSIFSNKINTEKLIFSDGDYVMDELFNLYDLKHNTLIKNFKKSDSCVNLDFDFVQFISKGRYFVTCTEDRRKILIIRCYDSGLVASVRLSDEISCITIGECERSFLAGTKNGYCLPFKLVVDLEHCDAIQNYVKFYRKNVFSNGQQGLLNSNDVNLKNDLKRVSHSSHAHRALKHKESRQSALIRETSLLMSNRNFDKFDSSSHLGVAKLNLTMISNGIKQSGTTSRACVIQ
ncbi:unnamed protein product [Brachionus calyciflorus]|uniref:NWD1/2-like winged helix-turn-helix domain-containing protein n=1 Tax=Brachionus calyciflorus TaxID=104777 RepID=A0A813N8F2_9BILA|nr:unnamed protein product [Brachionus calyciflorus]